MSWFSYLTVSKKSSLVERTMFFNIVPSGMKQLRGLIKMYSFFPACKTFGIEPFTYMNTQWLKWRGTNALCFISPIVIHQLLFILCMYSVYLWVVAINIVLIWFWLHDINFKFVIKGKVGVYWLVSKLHHVITWIYLVGDFYVQCFSDVKWKSCVGSQSLINLG